MRFDYPIPTNFSVDFVGDLEKINERFSKGRVRIYYKGPNRNGTWITDEFAEKLNQSITYIPIVGTYDMESKDFTDHTPGTHKKAYGFVPFEANPAWETADDGREYFTVDVILWPGYFEEAGEIIGKQQSMEIFPNSIVGDWKVIGGDYFFVYQQAEFKGLCALGDITTPCFEESAYYSLSEDNRMFLSKFSLNTIEKIGGKEMEKEIEVVAVSTVTDGITDFTSVETVEVPTEEVATFVETTVEEPATAEFTDGEVVVAEGEVRYAEDSITIVQDHMEATNNPDGSETVTRESNVQTIDITTYYALQAENEVLKNRIATLESENATLTPYKEEVFTQKKMTVIDSFKKRLDEDELAPFIADLSKFSVTDLKMQLSVLVADKLLSEDNSQLSTPPVSFVRIEEKQNLNEVETLLNKYKK